MTLHRFWRVVSWMSDYGGAFELPNAESDRQIPSVFYPLKFKPIFKQRVWGGRKLERLYGKELPPDAPIGESWEISDRAGDVSVVANGLFAGKDLRWLMEHHERDLLGDARSLDGRFPLLVKILDAQEKLSLQVHPPPARAAELGGEPKTELWYISDADPGAELYVGLKEGMTRTEFEKRIQRGTVAECFHRIRVKPGDVMFLPSGRVHAIGAGIVLFEIQQNSDTTYRVYDWGRVGLDNKPRALHVRESLMSIDFEDFEPSLVDGTAKQVGSAMFRNLVDDIFRVDWFHATAREGISLEPSTFRIVALLEGLATVTGATHSVLLKQGEFCLVPAVIRADVLPELNASFLVVSQGE